MRQKTFIKQTSLAILLYFICLALAVAIDLIFFKVKNMYHTPALAAIFAGWVYLGLIRKTKQFGAITCLGIFMSLFFFASGHFVLAFLPSFLAGLVADFLAKKGNYENSKLNLLSYMIFSLGNLAPIITMWLAPKAYIAQLLAKGKTEKFSGWSRTGRSAMQSVLSGYRTSQTAGQGTESLNTLQMGQNRGYNP